MASAMRREGDAVVDPEAARALVGTGQRQPAAHHRMRKAGGIEVDAETVRLRERDPRRKVTKRDRVAVDPLARREYGVRSVQVDALFAGDQGCGAQKIRRQFVKVARATGIVAGRLNAVARTAVGAVESGDVVALPAVD